MSDIEYSVIMSDVIKSFDCTPLTCGDAFCLIDFEMYVDLSILYPFN